MQCRWLHQDDANQVIVVFGGWALGPGLFAHLAGACDVLYVDDYRTLAPLPDLSKYTQRSLIAYSFGVAAFGHWQAQYQGQFDQKIAINGSLTPVHRREGIPPAIFQATHDGLSQESFQEFVTLCFGTEQPHHAIDTAARRAELAAVAARGPAPNPGFDAALISTADRIFPAANLRRAWAGHGAAPIEVDAPHVPFARWDKWVDLLAEAEGGRT
ncbi:DUF452 family protein [Cognatishimia sp. SS12]|uniref:pimeloyl-ACP methyl esterase BioG family protein n=1 Tax=Cognatishimia sp. SS12 TaxID=2979465 RepID=UPI002330883D|nr:pimeloyl-ACP methyl esterase BioG family protein [Cognatishimia sp. SS12]MDC0738454.1 DUF452 family protein [Cognatishimia sp. SS12]